MSAIIVTTGWILLVIGDVLLILGRVGRPVGGAPILVLIRVRCLRLVTALPLWV